jgi:outer membrane protein assembly factor BamB
MPPSRCRSFAPGAQSIAPRCRRFCGGGWSMARAELETRPHPFLITKAMSMRVPRHHLLLFAALQMAGCAGNSAKAPASDSGAPDSAADYAETAQADGEAADLLPRIDGELRDLPAGDGLDVQVRDGPDVPDASSAWFQTCVDGWPVSSTAILEVPSATSPKKLWTLALPGNLPIHAPIVATASLVALSEWAHIHLIDTAGAEIRSFQTISELASAPLADAAGNVYWSDATTAFSADSSGTLRWQAGLGAFSSTGEFLTPGPLLLDPKGVVYAVGLGGQLLKLSATDGSILENVSLPNSMNILAMGVGNAIFYIDPKVGLVKVSSGGFESVSDGAGWSPGWGAMGGSKIGLVAAGYRHDMAGTTAETVVLDTCGRLKWRLLGSLPLAIGFGDDLIVMDGQGPFELRRLSSAGGAVAGPISTDRPVVAIVGADDTLYVVTCSASAAKLDALNSTLHLQWTMALGSGCPTSATLGPTGILYYATQGLPGELAAIQTTSPGPGQVSWSRLSRDTGGTSWLGAAP